MENHHPINFSSFYRFHRLNFRLLQLKPLTGMKKIITFRVIPCKKNHEKNIYNFFCSALAILLAIYHVKHNKTWFWWIKRLTLLIQFIKERWSTLNFILKITLLPPFSLPSCSLFYKSAPQLHLASPSRLTEFEKLVLQKPGNLKVQLN